MIDPAVWLAVFITGEGTKYNSLGVSLHATREQCVAALSLTEQEIENGPYNFSMSDFPLNGFCIKVDEAVVTRPRTASDIYGPKRSK